ncbi:MAG: hypothetical protein HYT43_02405, partial [Candidatus Taylorbacteria bacterium]|nr:hypothetical protein [Candidatus Taylorbacteria bacterium]
YNISPGSKFKIEVCGTGGCDKSDNYFTVTSGTTQPSDTVSASVVSAAEDKAGGQYNFGPGRGNLNPNANDWNFQVNLSLGSSKTVKSMNLIHNVYGEGWSTSVTSPLGKLLYPIVVYRDGVQVNTSYDQLLGTYPSGLSKFYFYVQPETAPFRGGKLTINFTDGTSVSSTVPSSSVLQENKFVIGDAIAVTSAQSSINVRSAPGGAILGEQSAVATGRVIGGPQRAYVSGVYFIFWQVDFTFGMDGWVAEGGIEKLLTGALTISASGPAQSITAGAVNVNVANINLAATTSSEDLKMNFIELSTAVGSGPSNITKCVIYDGAISLQSGTNQVMFLTNSSTTRFNFDAPLIIQKGTTKTLALRCDFSTTAQGSFQFGYSAEHANPVVTGVVSGQSVPVREITSYAGLITVSRAGTLSVSLDPSSPPFKLAAAGTTDQTLTVLTVSAGSEPVELIKLAIQLSNSQYNSPSDVVKVTAYGVAYGDFTKVGEAYFAGINNPDLTNVAFGNCAGCSKFIITADSKKSLTLKADLASQGVSQLGTPGALVSIDYDNDSDGTYGTGLWSGTTINRTSTADTITPGVRVLKSYPTIEMIPLSNTKIAAGRRDLLKFKVTASPSGNVGLAELGFEIGAVVQPFVCCTDYLENFNLYGYTDSSFSVPMSGVQSDGALQSYNARNKVFFNGNPSRVNIGVNNLSGTSSSTAVIPAGAIRYFVLRADITLSGTSYSSVTSKLMGDSRQVFNPNYSTPTSNGTYLETFSNLKSVIYPGTGFIWTPFSRSTVIDLNAVDYANGYGVPGLPASGIQQVLTASAGSSAASVAESQLIELIREFINRFQVFVK